MPKAKVSKKTAKKSVKKSPKSSPKKSPKKTSAVKQTKTKTKKGKTSVKATGSRTRKVRKSDDVTRVLVCANKENCFWTNDGQILQDLNELNTALNYMLDEVYAHHVTKEKNDFADWVEYVLQDEECATGLRRARKPRSARTVVVRHLKYYIV